MHEERKREDGRKRLPGEGGGERGSGLQGWKSIPLDGVTSRAQLAPARVSFRRGFRIYCLSLTGVFCQAVSLLPGRQSYIHISIYSVHDEAASSLSLPLPPYKRGRQSSPLPRESSSSFIHLRG